MRVFGTKYSSVSTQSLRHHGVGELIQLLNQFDALPELNKAPVLKVFAVICAAAGIGDDLHGRRGIVHPAVAAAAAAHIPGFGDTLVVALAAFPAVGPVAGRLLTALI